jgi:hypothetical protein
MAFRDYGFQQMDPASNPIGTILVRMKSPPWMGFLHNLRKKFPSLTDESTVPLR